MRPSGWCRSPPSSPARPSHVPRRYGEARAHRAVAPWGCVRLAVVVRPPAGQFTRLTDRTSVQEAHTYGAVAFHGGARLAIANSPAVDLARFTHRAGMVRARAHGLVASRWRGCLAVRVSSPSTRARLTPALHSYNLRPRSRSGIPPRHIRLSVVGLPPAVDLARPRTAQVCSKPALTEW